MTPAVAIVGRPNVGKPARFNRLVGKKLALVDDRPGVTRDRREGEARLGDLEFRIVDTAGLEEAEEGSLLGRMRAQTEAALFEALMPYFPEPSSEDEEGGEDEAFDSEQEFQDDPTKPLQVAIVGRPN